MNFLRKFMGQPTAEQEIAVIPLGQFFLTRLPRLPKGAFECLYTEAYVLIKRTATPFYYQLCIRRISNADNSLAAESGDDTDDDDDDDRLIRSMAGDTNNHTSDEWTFTIGDELAFTRFDNDSGLKVISWKDLNGDLGDAFEFVVDTLVASASVDSFLLTLYKCVYEAMMEKLSEGIDSLRLPALADFVHDRQTGMFEDPTTILSYLQLHHLIDGLDDDDYEEPFAYFSEEEPQGQLLWLGRVKLRQLSDSEYVSVEEAAGVKLIQLPLGGYGLHIWGDTIRPFNLGQKLVPEYRYQDLAVSFVYHLDRDVVWILQFDLIEKLTMFEEAYTKAGKDQL